MQNPLNDPEPDGEFERTAARETVAQWMIENSFTTGHGDTLEDLLSELRGQISELREKAWMYDDLNK